MKHRLEAEAKSSNFQQVSFLYTVLQHAYASPVLLREQSIVVCIQCWTLQASIPHISRHKYMETVTENGMKKSSAKKHKRVSVSLSNQTLIMNHKLCYMAEDTLWILTSPKCRTALTQSASYCCICTDTQHIYVRSQN